MLESLRGSLWQVIGTLLAFAAIIVMVLLYLLQRGRKALSYKVISDVPLMSVREELEGKLQILFEGKAVRDVHMVIIEVLNSGNVPILPSDYERPVKFDFGEKAQILSAEVMKTAPSNVEASVSMVSGKVVLMPCLLNSGDAITLKILLTQYRGISWWEFGKLDVNGRIIGVTQIQRTMESLFPLPMKAAWAMWIGGMLFMLYSYENIGSALFVLGFVFMAVGIVRSPRYWPILRNMFKEPFILPEERLPPTR